MKTSRSVNVFNCLFARLNFPTKEGCVSQKFGLVCMRGCVWGVGGSAQVSVCECVACVVSVCICGVSGRVCLCGICHRFKCVGICKSLCEGVCAR